VSNLRLIARLDVKGPDLIKSVQLEGVRKVGDPRAFARRYYAEGADELVYMDAVASLYSRETLTELVRRTAEEVFVPITVGGGLRTAEDVRLMLRAGADKVAVNSAVTQRPELIRELAERFGSQCVVLQVDAKRRSSGGWEALRDGGREHTDLEVIDWVKRAEELGAGEILLTSVDREGTRRGFDVELIRAVTAAATIPVIASGGMGSVEHLFQAVEQGGADAVAMAHVLHYETLKLPEIRCKSRERGLMVRSA
jgi:cyclase